MTAQGVAALDSTGNIITKGNPGVNHNPLVQFKAIAGGATYLLVDEDDKLWATGDNQYGQCGVPNTKLWTRDSRLLMKVPCIERVSSISTGGFHSFVTDEDGVIWVFGMNRSGQLGLGDFKNRSSPVPLVVGAGAKSARK